MTTADVDVGWRHLLWTVAVSCAVAALFCVTVGVLTVVLARPVPFAKMSWWLVIPSLIVLLAGLIIRMDTGPQEPPDHGHNIDALILIVVGAVAVLLVGSGMLAGLLGTPIDARPDCPFPLQNPGITKRVVVCVSEERYNFAGAGGQRFFYGLLFIAYAEFARAALARLRRDF